MCFNILSLKYTGAIHEQYFQPILFLSFFLDNIIISICKNSQLNHNGVQAMHGCFPTLWCISVPSSPTYLCSSHLAKALWKRVPFEHEIYWFMSLQVYFPLLVQLVKWSLTSYFLLIMSGTLRKSKNGLSGDTVVFFLIYHYCFPWKFPKYQKGADKPQFYQSIVIFAEPKMHLWGHQVLDFPWI